MTSSNQRIVLASGNQGKLKELSSRLASLPIELVTQKSLDIEAAEETGLTFIENAILKARHAAQKSGLPAIADDSGIEVDALNGEPGIYSARYAGDDATDQANIDKLLTQLTSHDNKTARFHCVIVYLKHANDPCPLICQASWEGQITDTLSGEHGFGYDPIFWLPALNKTAAELSRGEKNQISHRGKALNQLLPVLENVYGKP